MKLSEFITAHTEEILTEWEAFAKTLLPAAAEMSSSDLRDDAKQILHAIALDLETDQTAREQTRKSKGLMGLPAGSAATVHGQVREASGFTLVQLVAEYRALRASVLRLWQHQSAPLTQATIDDLIRFNEAIDQALAESIHRFSERAQRTRDTFLAMLGHDLRTPLHSITLSAEYLSGASLQRNGIDRTSVRLKRSAARMAAMVHDLLEYSRVQLGGKMKIVHTRFNFKELAEAALLDASAAYPDCPFELDTSGDLTASVDGARVHQMLTNLLSNAAQYRDETYSVTLSVIGEPDEIVVHVKNRGPVISSEFFEAIFNPLVQLKIAAGDSSRPATSLGLGLHIARSIAVAHDGTISVTSTERDGTVFTVRLPRDQRRRADVFR
jgi:signal transduction histidine kinase